MLTVKAVLLSMMVSYAPYNINGVSIDEEQALCLAMNVYHEAKGETLAGKSAVAHVTMNRVAHKKYPNNVCDVIFDAQTRVNWKGNIVPIRDRCQFSWYCDGKADDIISKENNHAWRLAQDIAFNVMVFNKYSGLVEGATHYHADYVDPSWNKTITLVTKIDDHIFYRWD